LDLFTQDDAILSNLFYREQLVSTVIAPLL